MAINKLNNLIEILHKYIGNFKPTCCFIIYLQPPEGNKEIFFIFLDVIRKEL